MALTSFAAPLGASLAVASALAACQPSVRVEAPREPITINLNVKLEEQAEKDIENAPDIF